jgi:glycosyltransferase involved in cell wall biosynthesis
MHPPVSATKRALFLTPELPALDQGGGAMRSASLVAYLERNYKVDVVTFALSPHSKSMAARIMRNSVRLVRGRPPLFDRYSGYEAQIRESIPAQRYDLAVIEHFWCASYADLLRPLCDRLILDLHNVESELALSHAATINGAARLAVLKFAQMYEALEGDWLPKFDTLLVASHADRKRVQHSDIRLFPNAIPESAVPSVVEEPTVIFTGNLEYHPNVEAVRWFAREIWPLIRTRLPNIEWKLVGRNPEAVAAVVRGASGARLIGPVTDAIAELARNRIVAVPLLAGSGTRFKILEAWAAQRAVVSTTIGAEGLGARDGEHLLLADEPESFANAVLRLWADNELRERLGRAGRNLYLKDFTWPSAWRTLNQQGAL